MIARRPLIEGIGCALGAGLLWGLVFVAPLWLSDYPAAVLSVGRYLAFGLIALPLALMDRHALSALGRADWIEAAKLSLVGNLLYYGCLAAGIQFAGAPLPTMLIGTLPLVIAISANLTAPALPWRSLAGSLALIAAGLALVNRDELAHLRAAGFDGSRLAIGAALTLGALACWTWYPIRNARWLQRHAYLRSTTWATAQGLTTLPLALAGALLLTALPAEFNRTAGGQPFDGPLGTHPARFVGLMLAIGLLASWLGTLLWNRASRLLPTALGGQLIVFETLAALLYAYLLRGTWPGWGALVGIALLVVGVIVGAQSARRAARSPQVAI